MTQQECDKAKQEYWEEFKQLGGQGWESKKYIFDFAFDRAYALGKQTKAIIQEEIEKTAKKYAEKTMEDVYSEEWDSEYVQDLIESAWYDGVNFALGKQEKNAEETVIQGWVARDEDGHLFMYCTKPERDEALQVWMGRYADFDLRNALFPDLTWDSEPEEVEIILKRKKK